MVKASLYHTYLSLVRKFFTEKIPKIVTLFQTFSFISEQKVVPGAVVLLALAYFVVATSYYYE